MSDDSADRIVEMITAAQPHLAAFAQESYGRYGRGMVRVAFPGVPGQRVAIVSAEMVYHDLDETRQLLGGAGAGEGEAMTLTMIETYDPARQAVVVASIGTGPGLTVKMPLDAPADHGDRGVH